jgi:hypothetical protein
MHSIDASRGLRMPWPDWICRTTRRPQPDLRKAGEYCEQLHDDDRAGFYDCLNSRVKSSAGPAICGGLAPSLKARTTRSRCRLLALRLPMQTARRAAKCSTPAWRTSVVTSGLRRSRRFIRRFGSMARWPRTMPQSAPSKWCSVIGRTPKRNTPRRLSLMSTMRNTAHKSKRGDATGRKSHLAAHSGAVFAGLVQRSSG